MEKISQKYINHEVSKATLIAGDIIISIHEFLDSLGIDYDLMDDSDNCDEEAFQVIQDDYLYEYLFDLMNDIAPEGCDFGSHQGNGACIGFWKNENNLKD